MDTREKLIELLDEAEEHSSDVCCFNSTCEDCPGRKYGNKCRDYLKADHLIANGVGLREQDCHWATEQAYKNGYKKGKADALKWIPVTERLPELHTKVLCCGIKGGRFIAELGTWGHERHLCWDKKNGRGCPEVTHWMPLPEPPKGE